MALKFFGLSSEHALFSDTNETLAVCSSYGGGPLTLFANFVSRPIAKRSKAELILKNRPTTLRDLF